MAPSILVGTRKGLFVLRGDDDRRTWTVEEPSLSGWEVFHAVHHDGTLYAAANNFVYGATVQRSSDGGKTWERSEGLGLPGREPPRKEPRARDPFLGEEDLDAYLQETFAPPREAAAEAPQEAPKPAPSSGKPAVHVPTPEEMEAALSGPDEVELPDDMAESEAFRQDRGQAQPKGPLPGVVVGATLAESLGLELGDEVRIISPLAGLDTSLWQPDGGAPRSLAFRVIGVFQAGFQEYDTRLVYVHLYEAQRFFDHGDAVTGVEIRLDDINEAPHVARQLEADLGGGPYHTMDWQELNHNLFTALEMQKVMLSLVIATIIFVAAFNVIATLIMIVLEKKREIAILKAMGAKDSGILSIFLVQGVVIGLVGTALCLLLGGLVTGYLSVYSFPLDPKVYLIDHLPVRVTPLEFAETVLIALAICTAATLFPSYWAARLLPADGVRYE